jgi:hypothetical protein
MKPTHAHAVQSRTARLAARIRDTACPRSTAILVRTMTAHFDPEAIPALVGLLDLPSERVGSVERALVRYGEAAEESLKAYAARDKEFARHTAEHLLARIAYRARLRQLGCF